MNPSLTHKFSFGKIIVDPESNTIYLNGVEKRLEPKLIDLLSLLAAQGRSVISRQEITQAIWPDVIVGEESITRAIFALRNALNDDAKRPQYIETIPKKGYRFLVDAQLISEPAPDAQSPIGNSFSIRQHKNKIILLSLIALMVLLGILASGQNKPTTIEIENVLPLNKMEGVEREINLSADGKELLFVHDKGKTIEIVSRDLLAAKDAVWVKDEIMKKSPMWIDSNTIAYIRHIGSEFQLVRHYKNQLPQIVYTSNRPILQLGRVEKNLDDLFFLEHQNNDLIELKSFNLRNGSIQNWRDFIPDLPKKMSRTIYSLQPNTLLVLQDENIKPSIISVDLHTKKIRQITNVFNKVNTMSTVDDQGFLVVGTLDVTQGIWLVEGEKQPQLVLRASGSEEIVGVQVDNKRNLIFYANSEINQDMQLVSNDTVVSDELLELNSSGIEMRGTFAENNNTIYFISNRTGHYEVWRYEMDSKLVKQISNLQAVSINCISVSHDGKHIAVSYRTDDLYLGIIDIDKKVLRQKTKTPSLRYPLAWSQDDKTIYVSEHEAEVNLYRYDAESLTVTLFANNAGLYVQDSNGQHIIYVDYLRHGLVERNVADQQERVLHNTIPNLSYLSPGMLKVNKDKNLFYALCDAPGPGQICSYSLSASNSSPLILKTLAYDMWLNDISMDGEKLLVTRMRPPSGDIMKMQFRYQ